jgi:hypothetical protein
MFRMLSNNPAASKAVVRTMFFGTAVVSGYALFKLAQLDGRLVQAEKAHVITTMAH